MRRSVTIYQSVRRYLAEDSNLYMRILIICRLGIVGSRHDRHLSVDVWKIVKSGRLLKQYEHKRVPFDPVKSGLKDFFNKSML